MYSSRSLGARHGQHEIIALGLRVVLVVVVHRRAVVSELVGRDAAPERLKHGRGVHPEFADEPPFVFRVVEERNILRLGSACDQPHQMRWIDLAHGKAVPDVPIVDVALDHRVGLRPAIRAPGPIGREAIQVPTRPGMISS
jgi:hypothetical protein